MVKARTAMVVGGAGGIGSEVCRHLADVGYQVVVADIDEAKAREVTAGLSGSGHRSIAFDVTAPQAVERAFDQIEHGGPAAVLVVASGGTFVDPTNIPNVAATSAANWDRTVAVNLTGSFHCVSHFARLRLVAALAHSRIILFSSGSGEIGGTPVGVAYAASKAGLIGLTRHAAIELAPADITVNAIAPGPIGTPELFRATSPEVREALSQMTPLRRFGKPAEVAAAVAYLASEEAAFITGTTLDINGGGHMH